ncbi:MAG: hypothetical protein AAF624_16525, partial [Bacteroidota bacterium]
VGGLILFCWLYPLYTLGFRLIPGFVGNILTFVAAVVVLVVIASSSRTAAALIAPVAAWCALATVYAAQLVWPTLAAT